MLTALILTCFIASIPVLADPGFDAYNRGDYATAVQLWGSMAKRGEVSAQFNLGLMYLKGNGVGQDYKEGRKWLLKAARQGYARAQLGMGMIYLKGLGVQLDYVQAYMWIKLAEKQGG